MPASANSRSRRASPQSRRPAPARPEIIQPGWRAHVSLLRIGQWVKNGFIAAPLIFSGAFTDFASVSSVLFLFILFCLAASSVYVFNDIHDLEQDRHHPEKSRRRPLAAGAVSVRAAWVWIVFLWVAALLVGFLTEPRTIILILIYAGANIGYTLFFKTIALLDLFFLASFFMLRIYAGGLVIRVDISPWMALSGFALALYLGVVKRRAEFINSSRKSRIVLEQYTLPILDFYAQTSAVASIALYGFFAIAERPSLAVTTPLVLYGMFRHWFLIERLGSGEKPVETIFKDGQMIICVGLWLLLCMYLVVQ